VKSSVRRGAARLAVGAVAAGMGLLPARWRPAAARLLPGSSARFGPPRRWLHHPDYVARHGGEWRVVEARHTIERSEPRVLGSNPLVFRRPFRGPVPDAGVLLLEHVRLGGRSWLIGRPDCFLPDNSWYHVPMAPSRLGDCPVWTQGWAAPPLRVTGRCLSLVTDWAETNYFHFLVDALARIHLSEGAGVRLDDVDWIYVPGLDTPMTRWLLDRLGVPARKRITSAEHPWIVCDALVAPSFPGQQNNHPRWVVDYVRRRFGAPAARRGRRLYVSRRGATRRIVNEPELEAVLTRRGFETLVPGSGPTDIERFAEASVVVGGHGAGLANVVFCAEGAIVLELMPPRYQPPTYYVLCDSGGLRYACLVGRSVPRGRERTRSVQIEDYVVDGAEMEAALDALGVDR